jgi:hypothetical protein
MSSFHDTTGRLGLAAFYEHFLGFDFSRFLALSNPSRQPVTQAVGTLSANCRKTLRLGLTFG